MRTTRSVSFLSSAVLVSIAVVLGACGDDADVTTDPASGGPSGLVSSDALTVCSDTPYEPFEFEGPDGEQVGYDIDLLRAIAADAELELVVKDLPFDGILGSLQAGACDVVASAVTITEERAGQVDFSAPYFDADQSLLVKADKADTYRTLADLTGQRIAVQSGTTGETYANEHKPEGATVVSFEDADGLFGAITSGDVAAVLQDFPVNAYRATKDTSLAVTEKFPTGEQYGYAVKKGNASVLSFVDDGLATLRADGRFDAVFATYFGESQ